MSQTMGENGSTIKPVVTNTKRDAQRKGPTGAFQTTEKNITKEDMKKGIK